jgi:hypothetical protein
VRTPRGPSRRLPDLLWSLNRLSRQDSVRILHLDTGLSWRGGRSRFCRTGSSPSVEPSGISLGSLAHPPSGFASCRAAWI